MRILEFGLKFFAIFGICLLVAGPAISKEDGLPDEAPKIFKSVIDCRSITDPVARLTCYDTNVSKLDEAQRKNELFVADKEQVRETQRGLFGLSLPKIKIFGKGNDVEEIREISALITSVRSGPRGWIFELDDGTVWGQTDSRYYGRSPKPGQTLLVKIAAIGSYMAKVDSGATFRAERLNRFTKNGN